MPWRISCGPTAAPSRGCCATSPMSCVRLWPECASPSARTPASRDVSRQLDRLEREIERLDSLISQVLKLARCTAPMFPFAREIFDLDEVIEEVVRDANFEGAVKNCRVRLHGAANAAIDGNRDLVRSAVENVLRNAVRYSPSDEPVDVPSPGRLRRFPSPSETAAQACRRPIWSAYSSPFTASPNRAIGTAAARGSDSRLPLKS